jgi:hypothetical protein
VPAAQLPRLAYAHTSHADDRGATDLTAASAMKRLLCIASLAPLLLLSQPGNGRAERPFDGEWTGSATVTSGRCRPALTTLTVEGKVVTGEARFESGPLSIHGTVYEDGAFGATIGFQRLVGTFIEDSFEGTFNSFNCAWKMTLKRTK